MNMKGALLSLLVTTGFAQAEYQYYPQAKPNFHPCAYGNCSCLPQQQIDTLKLQKSMEQLKKCIHELEADYNAASFAPHNQDATAITALTKALEELKKVLQEKNTILRDTTLDSQDKVRLGVIAIIFGCATYMVTLLAK